MKEEVIFRMESAYREDFEVKSYHFGGPEKTMCIIGNMRGNEIQQLYIAGQMVRTLKRFEEEGRFIRRHGVTVIPCANPYSVNVGKRFWAMDNSDINRMYPGYNKGETTQRIAAGIFEKIQGYRFGVQFSSFYMPGDFVSHVRMMKTDYEDTGLAQLFGMPFVVLRKPVPFDTTTLNFNWQVWDTKAFSLYSRSTEKIDKKGADMAIAAVCRFLSRMNVLNYNVYGGYESSPRMADVSYNIPDLRPGEVFRVEQTIKRSRFIASVGHTPDVEEAKAFIEQIKAEFEDARHNCWAYCAGAAGSTDRIGASDDGEPHGTAGRPMLTAVTHSGIGEVTVVVTRYFGGILLGTGGLVKAYQSSVKMALEGVSTRVRTKTKRIKFSVEHRFVNQVLRKIEAVNGRILEKNFDMDADFDVEIPEDLAETFAKELEELTRGALLIEFVEE